MSSALPSPFDVQPLPGGIYCVDTGFQRPRFDAAYLVVNGGEAAFIDSGTNHSVPRLLAALESTGLTRDAVRWVIPTHVHLDHAGGVGLLMQHLPRAQVVAHPRGAKHLVDPSALWAGALAVYGEEEMRRSYGELQPIAAARVQTSSDGMQLPLGARLLTFMDSPGHARHHHAIWDPVTQGWFTGDTFGLSYREHDVAGQPWIFPTTTPVQFEPEAMRDSVERMLAREPECVYLTHYGRLGEPQALARKLLALLDEVVALGQGVAAQGLPTAQRHAMLVSELTALYVRDLQAHGLAASAEQIAQDLSIDIELNAQGMGVWLDKLAKEKLAPSPSPTEKG